MRDRSQQVELNLKRLEAGTLVSYHHQGFEKVGTILCVEPDSFKIDCQVTREIHTVPLYSIFIEPLQYSNAGTGLTLTGDAK